MVKANTCTNYYLVLFTVKGQSNEIFDSNFVSSFDPAWVTDQCVKIFSILVKNTELFEFFGISYCAVSVSSQNNTAGSHVIFPDPI